MAGAAGIGGIFFRARDPEALARWYETHLGIAPAPDEAGGSPWFSEAGVTVFAPFPADSDYFPKDRAFMINFRVDDIAALLVSFARAGVTVHKDETHQGLGRFVHVDDPEGNRIELWEPSPETRVAADLGSAEGAGGPKK